jgi:hypothetical protein
MKLFWTLLLLISLQCKAQYPFEKFPSIKYEKLHFAMGFTESDTTFIATANYKKYQIKLRQNRKSATLSITVHYKAKTVFKYSDPDFNLSTLQDTIYVADIDGNGHIDFKFLFFNDGSGLAGSLEKKLYFFNKGNFKFHVISYVDFFNFPERDFNGDGNYEIIGDVLNHYQDHAYWTFNLFNYIDGRLVNVNRKFNYPIMVQYLFRENYTVTDKISRKKMKQFSLSNPDYFKSRGL